MSIITPEWVKHAVFYQIFPDRFSRSTRTVHQRGIEFKPWGTPPEEQGFQGGDLLGIVDRLDYLSALGITALYLNPVFSSAANHRYHTFDYYQVDPILGGEKALRELLDQAHRRGMRVVLDAVFNHGSRGFWAFHHILEVGENSPYLDWFHIHGWPLRPYSSDEHNPPNYDAWWGIPDLPKFNFDNEGVRDYFLEVSQHWINFGIDGWRIDVPEEIQNDDFWREFRQVVKRANPEAYILGEIWHEGHDWLQGDRFDAIMNYALNRAALGFFAHDTLRTDYSPGGYELRKLTVEEFAGSVEYLLNLHEPQIVQAQLNLLDSHDTARVQWIVDDDQSAHRLCLLFQMTMPGAPCVYYGDEIGMKGAHDPYCRAAFPWHDKGQWDTDLLKFYREAIQMRHRYPALRIGEYETLYVADNVYGFQRQLGRQSAIVCFNAGSQKQTISIHAGNESRAYLPIWPPEKRTQKRLLSNAGKIDSLTIAGRTASVWIAE